MHIARHAASSHDIFWLSLAKRFHFKLLLSIVYWFKTQYENSSLLHWAAKNDRRDVAESLLKQPHANVNNVCQEKAALMRAVAHGSESVVQVLLERADTKVNHKDQRGWTALWLAVDKGYMGITQQLLASGRANINEPDHEDRTPIFRAIRAGNEGLAQLLLDHADINLALQDHRGLTPLLYAVL